MSRSYALDVKSASTAGTSNYITETGKYKGTFTRAEIVTSQAGTEGVELSFVAADGLRSDFLSLWTYNTKGEALPSLKVLNAIMACLRIRELTPAQVNVERHDGSKESVQGFPALMNKPIGVLLQKEEYEKTKRGDDGQPIIGYKFNLLAPFDAATELTAGEILSSKTQPEQLARMVAMLKDKPLQKRKQSGGGDSWRSEMPSSMPDDDSIPFISTANSQSVHTAPGYIGRVRHGR